MAYRYNIFLPGLGKEIAVKEINSAIYRDLIKSLYNEKGDLFLAQLNNTIELIAPGILQEQTTVIDYLILLLSTRMICVSPDLKLTDTCPETKKVFEITIRIEDLIDKLSKIQCKKKLTKNEMTINFSLAKARDVLEIYRLDKSLESFNLAVSSLDSITANKNLILLNGLKFEDRIKVLENLPVLVSNELYKELLETYNTLAKIQLIKLYSPFKEGLITTECPVSVSPNNIFAFLKLIFNEDLSNVYRLVYNLVSIAGFEASFLDTITPAEQSLFWTFHLQRVNKETEGDGNKGGNGDVPFAGRTIPFNQVGPSEFSGK